MAATVAGPPPGNVPPMSRRAQLCLLSALLAAVTVLGTACGDDDGGGSGGGVVGSPDEPVAEVTVVSPDQSFDPEQIYVPAGEEVSLTYANRDDGIAHNFRIRTDASSADQPATDLSVGPDTQTMTFTLDAGEYTYVCDIHPNMRGTVTAV